MEVRVDQTKEPPIDKQFLSLGEFKFSDKAVVEVSNAGTTGFVVDAVQLLKKIVCQVSIESVLRRFVLFFR